MAYVLGFDKTFNLGDTHVTVGVFKHMAVKSNVTAEHPIIVGPIYLHSISSFVSYAHFFSQLSVVIGENIPSESLKLFIGTDDEFALRKAVSHSFPNSTQILCTRHLKNNVIDYLTNQAPVEKTVRCRIVGNLFGQEGLANSESEAEFQERSQEIVHYSEQNVPRFTAYLQNRLIPLIKKYVFLPRQKNPTVRNWTNNNAESVNHILKLDLDWKPRNLYELTNKLYETVKSQYVDIQRALYGRGNYVLFEQYKHHFVDPAVWEIKNEQEQNQLFLNFLRDSRSGLKGKYVHSTDGARFVPTPSGGKKPGQRKRRQAERSRTPSKQTRKKLDL